MSPDRARETGPALPLVYRSGSPETFVDLSTSPVGQNRTQTRALIYVRWWGKSGSRWARVPDVVPIAVTHGPVRHVGRTHGPGVLHAEAPAWADGSEKGFGYAGRRPPDVRGLVGDEGALLRRQPTGSPR